MSKLFLIIGATVVVLGGINAKAEERPAFETIRISNHADPGCCVGFCWRPREITDADAHALRNAGVPASGGGSVATAA